MIKRLIGAVNRRLNPAIRKEEEFRIRIGWIGFKVVEEDEKYLVVSGQNYPKIWLRKGTSDLIVFEQVFLNKEFLPLVLSAQDNKIEIETIVDAGANCGLTSILFLTAFPRSTVIAVEPDPDNFEVLEKNTQSFGDRVKCLQMAIWKTNEQVQLTDDFGDGQAWARAVKPLEEKGSNAVKGITIYQLLDNYGIASCDFFKMDIEGTEALLFSDEAPPSFLARVKCLAIEIHGHLNCRDKIVSQLHEANFVVAQCGASTMAIRPPFKV